MGWGDELMAAGQAARTSRETGQRVCIVDRHNQARFHELWEGLDFISPVKAKGCAIVVNGPGVRPYIEYPFTHEGHGYTNWRARDNRPVISPRLVGERKPWRVVLIEPTIKRLANKNKRWTRWQEVVDALPEVAFMQCGPDDGGVSKLRGSNVTYTVTPTFVDAVRLLNQSALYLGAEGGMHHAAAALNVPAVVIFGGSPSVAATGYPDHINFGGDAPCGRWEPCSHCVATMNAITPDKVAAAVKELLK
jgi:ADP-heptose:LPS heptosyltransferase